MSIETKLKEAINYYNWNVEKTFEGLLLAQLLQEAVDEIETLKKEQSVFHIPKNCTQIKITCKGAGGGGGSDLSKSSYASALYKASDLPSTVPITVGSGKGKSGDSKFGEFLTAYGGVEETPQRGEVTIYCFS